MNSKTVSITIRRSAEEVYCFLAVPANFKKRAAGLGKLEEQDGSWFAETPTGRMKVRFTGRNTFGVLDHFVKPENAEEIYVPMRVVPNSEFAEVIFTLFQESSMSEADLAHDLELVRADLNSLKNILESSSHSRIGD